MSEPRRTTNPRGRASVSQRQNRRSSTGPYPRPSPSPEAEEQRREEAVAEEEGEREEGVHASGSGEVREEVGVVALSTTSGDRKFHLVICQQPEIGASAGPERITLGRLPIVPAPVIQVIVRDSDGEEVDVELPYLFCSCSLRQEDGLSAVEITAPDSESESYSVLLGGLVRNAHRVTDLEGKEVNVFVFEDMSVRVNGTFTLEFRLSEARPKSPKLAAVTSAPFQVVDRLAYPGRPAEDIYTALSKHLHEQSVPLYIPALVLPSPNAHPPPASLNPFPADADIPGLALARTP